MKIIKTVFFSICLTLLNVYNALAQDEEPPHPPEQPPSGHVVPIDDHLILLIIAGVLLGITLIYKDRIEKASI